MPNLCDAIENVVKQTTDPIAANVQIYERLYQDVYLKMYARLQPLYGSIRSITGYPF